MLDGTHEGVTSAPVAIPESFVLSAEVNCTELPWWNITWLLLVLPSLHLNSFWVSAAYSIPICPPLFVNLIDGAFAESFLCSSNCSPKSSPEILTDGLASLSKVQNPVNVKSPVAVSFASLLKNWVLSKLSNCWEFAAVPEVPNLLSNWVCILLVTPST